MEGETKKQKPFIGTRCLRQHELLPGTLLGWDPPRRVVFNKQAVEAVVEGDTGDSCYVQVGRYVYEIAESFDLFVSKMR